MSKYTLKKRYLVCLLLCVTSCTRIDTNAQPVFHEVQEEITNLTGQNVYWDSSLEDTITPISVEKMLEEELTEDFIVQIALLNNRSLQATYEGLGIAKAQLAQAGLLKNPIFSFSYEFSTQLAVTDLINIGLLQNFLEILLMPLKKRTARAELEATKDRVTTQILSVIAETKIAFHTLQASQQIWNLQKLILLANELAYEAAEKLFEAGNIKDLEVSMERSLYEQAKLEVASWEIAVLEARERLNILMGLWGQQIEWKISDDLRALPSKEGDYTDIENSAIANSIDLKAAYNELIATASRFGIDTSRIVFPQLDIGVASERDEGVWYAGPAFNLAIPFFDRGKANSAKARAEIMQQWNQYTALAIEIRSAARSSRFSLLNAFGQSRYAKEIIVPLSKEVTHLTLLQHNAMQLGIFHLLSAKRRELEKEIQAAQLQRDYWVAKIRLQTLLNGHTLGGRHE